MSPGHRPRKLGGYTPEVEAKLLAFAAHALARLRPREVVSGMALGWDMALAEAAVNLGIPFVATIPFEGQERTWPAASQERHQRLLRSARIKVVVGSALDINLALSNRNEWMVDVSDMVIALWDGSSGGTRNCVKYAQTKGRPVTNLWHEWLTH